MPTAPHSGAMVVSFALEEILSWIATTLREGRGHRLASEEEEGEAEDRIANVHLAAVVSVNRSHTGGWAPAEEQPSQGEDRITDINIPIVIAIAPFELALRSYAFSSKLIFSKASP